MEVTTSTLITKIYERMPEIDLKVLKTIEEVLESELADCKIEKETYELMPVNNNARLIQEYILALKMSNKSDKTIAQYVSALRGMLFHVAKEATDIKRKDLKKYYAWYAYTHTVSAVTMLNLQRYISPFFRFLLKEEYIQANPAEFIEVPKIQEPKIEAIAQEEIEVIRDASSEGKMGVRNRALIEFLLATGCRIGEVSGCKLSDVDFATKSVVVTGKGSKTRTVFFNGTCVKYLKDYLNTRTDNVDYLFVSKDNTAWSTGAMETLCRKLGEKTSIHCNPHRFRHTFAQICIDRGMKLEDLSKIMGHEEVSTTMRYFRVNKNKIETAYKKFVA